MFHKRCYHFQLVVSLLDCAPCLQFRAAIVREDHVPRLDIMLLLPFLLFLLLLHNCTPVHVEAVLEGNSMRDEIQEEIERSEYPYIPFTGALLCYTRAHERPLPDTIRDPRGASGTDC